MTARREYRSFLPAAIAAALLWLATAIGFHQVSGLNPGPHQFVGHLLPQNVSSLVWNWAGPWWFLMPVLSAMVVALAHLVLSPLATGASRAPRFLALWFAAVAAGVVASLPWAIGITLATFPPARPAFLFNAVDDVVLTSAYWGLLWGWLPALVALRSTDAPPTRRGRRLAINALVVVAVLATVSVVTGARTPAPGQPETEQSAVAPTPPPAVAEGSTVDRDWCTPDQTMLLLGGKDAATGHRLQTINITNFSQESCVLEGYPDLAFADAGGSAIDVTVVHGGSFMAQDAGPVRLELAPGSYATFSIGWDAQAGPESDAAASLHAAAYPGYPRGSWPWDVDVFAGGQVWVTAWQAVDGVPSDERD